MAYIIYTMRIDGSGSVRRDKYECDTYHIFDGIIDFWNPKLTKRSLISIHKMDYIMIEDVGNMEIKEEKGDEIKCIT
jgi:hypothetical protein